MLTATTLTLREKKLFQQFLLESVVGDRAGAEAVDVVETDQHTWAAGAGDGGKVAGGPALGTLTLIILEVIIFCLLAVHHPLMVLKKTNRI